jgi:hypothetical protein
MKKTILAITTMLVLSGLATTTHAQTIVVWSTTNFLNDPVGPYGTHTDFGCGSSPALNIVDPGIGGPGTHAMELTFSPTTNTCINFQTAGISYPAAGNTRTNLSDYTIEFDMQVNGLNAGPFPQGFQISIFGPGGGVFSGPKVELDLKTNVFIAGAGYQHYSFPLSSFTPRSFDPTAASFTVGIGIVSYAANFTFTNEAFDIANLQITMSTAPVPPPGTVAIWSTTNFVYDPLGTYGAVVDFQGGENLALNIVAPGELGGAQAAGDQAMEVTFNPTQPNINFQTCSVPYPTSGSNTNTYLGAYTLLFDMQVNGTNNVSPASGLQLSLFADKTGPSGFYVFGANLLLPNTVTNVFTAGTGYQHYSFPLSSFKDSSFDITGSNFCVGVGYVSYPANLPATSTPTFDFAYFQIVMATNPPPPPQPKMNVLASKPGLRIFQKCSDAVYTQEGIGTEDGGNPMQSWVGGTFPKTYAITFQDFDTVAGYTMNIQFCPGAAPGNPYGVYSAPNDLLWRITSGGGASGFTTSVGFKTNSPSNNNGGETNVLLATTTTTSLNGRGTWTLTFTSDAHGTVTAPGGILVGSFDMDTNASAMFADPLTILFGTSAGQTGGFGQFIDLARIAITNVAGVNEFDDFTQDDVLNTNLWNPNFSRDNPGYNGNNDAGAVILVSSNTPSFWANWTIPDGQFGLATKASLTGGTNVWFTPGYYGSGTGATNTIPSLMGTSLKWTLIPSGCLPTVDGSTNGAASRTAFFRLSNPAPSQ